MAKLIIPTPLRKFTGDKPSFESSAGTVKALINDLVEAHPTLKQHLLDDQGALRSFVRVYVGEDDIQSLDNENTLVHEATVVSIIPAIAGGVD